MKQSKLDESIKTFEAWREDFRKEELLVRSDEALERLENAKSAFEMMFLELFEGKAN